MSNTPPTEIETSPAPSPTTTNLMLVEPIMRPSGPLTQLALRKPRAGELRGLKIGELFQGDAGSVITLLPRITDPFITDAEAANLSCEDIAEASGIISGFFLTPAQKAMVAQMMGG